MIVEEKDFRAALQSVIKGGIITLALCLLKAVTAAFHVRGGYYGSMSVTEWIGLAISLFIVGFLITLYGPVKTVATFYLAALVKVGKLPGREKYMDNLASAAGNVTLLLFVLCIYGFLLPVTIQCSNAFLRSRSLIMILSVAALLAVIVILLLLWRNAYPMIDLLTGRIADKVSTLSSGLAYVACPACHTKNDRDATFCASCGAKMGQPPPAPPKTSNACPKCAAENLPGSKFCLQCGTPLARATPKPQPQTRRCASCGTENEIKDRFCAKCGTNLQVAASAGN